MLSALLAIAGFVSVLAAIFLLFSHFWQQILFWFDWSIHFIESMGEWMPDFLLPVAAVSICLALIALGVKIL